MKFFFQRLIFCEEIFLFPIVNHFYYRCSNTQIILSFVLCVTLLFEYFAKCRVAIVGSLYIVIRMLWWSLALVVDNVNMLLHVVDGVNVL